MGGGIGDLYLRGAPNFMQPQRWCHSKRFKTQLIQEFVLIDKLFVP